VEVPESFASCGFCWSVERSVLQSPVMRWNPSRCPDPVATTFMVECKTCYEREVRGLVSLGVYLSIQEDVDLLVAVRCRKYA